MSVFGEAGASSGFIQQLSWGGFHLQMNARMSPRKVLLVPVLGR